MSLFQFDSKLQALRISHAKELGDRIATLRSRVQQGWYDDTDLGELANILKSIRQHITGNDTRLSDEIGISGRTIATTYNGISRPKYHNFMRMLHRAEAICLRESRSGEIGIALGESVQDQHQAKWIELKVNQTLIGEVVDLLERLVVIAARSNDSAASASAGLTDLQKAQLIKVLETAIAMLKSPLVEVGLLSQLRGWLFKIGKKGVEDELQGGIGRLAQEGAEKLGELFQQM